MKKFLFITGLILLLTGFVAVAYAAESATGTFRPVSLNVPIPVDTSSKPLATIEFGQYTGYLLKYLSVLLAWIGGLLGMLCVGIFIFSGFQIVTSAGNSEMVSQAKTRIMDTIFGLLLLITSALLLHTINPGFFRWNPDDPDPEAKYGKIRTILIQGESATGDCSQGSQKVLQEAYANYVRDYEQNAGPHKNQNLYCWPKEPDLHGAADNNKCEFFYNQNCRWEESSIPNAGPGDEPPGPDEIPPEENPPENKCKDPVGRCAEANMTAFGSDAALAAQICQRESTGNTNAVNTACLTGKSKDYSVGLMQINMLWSGFGSDGRECWTAFARESGAGNEPVIPCQILKPDLLTDCVARYQQTENNIEAAKKLAYHTDSGWNNWSTYTRPEGGARACFQ